MAQQQGALRRPRGHKTEVIAIGGQQRATARVTKSAAHSQAPGGRSAAEESQIDGGHAADGGR